jgi:hypothetical protein
MQFDPKLTGDAATLARAHAGILRRLPATVSAFALIELQKWPVLFAAERRYQRALLEHLSQVPADTLQQLVAGIVRVEGEAAVDRVSERDPARFQDLAQAAFRKRSLLPDWRREIDQFFQQVDRALDAQLYPPDAPRRVIVQVYGTGVAIQPQSLWRRFKGVGVRIPLTKVRGGADGFLKDLFDVRADDTGSSLFARLRDDRRFTAEDTWLVESHDGLHGLAQSVQTSAPFLTGLSYDRLRSYRDQLMRALYSKIQSGVESPQAFAAYARSLTLAPDPGVLLHHREVIQSFIRDVLISGNGTLFVNNTFTEWAAVQALRRAQPRFLVARYGVRDKLKPFSSLLLFSEPRRSDRIPLVEDPLGSFIDVEQLCYYVWVNAGKSSAYRSKTLYVFLAEDADEMLAIRSDVAAPAPSIVAPAQLADVSATIARWLDLSAADASGRPIPALDPIDR